MPARADGCHFANLLFERDHDFGAQRQSFADARLATGGGAIRIGTGLHVRSHYSALMKTVFVDRDGVINRKPKDGAYVTSWSEFDFIPGAIDAIRVLNAANWRVIAVTNQRGIARGMMTAEDLEGIHRRMLDELNTGGAHLDAIYYCPHAERSCECRKPGIGLFLKAKADFPDIAFDDTFVIGDSDGDMEAGRRLGARLIRIGQVAAPDELGSGSLADAVDRYVLAEARERAD